MVQTLETLHALGVDVVNVSMVYSRSVTVG